MKVSDVIPAGFREKAIRYQSHGVWDVSLPSELDTSCTASHHVPVSRGCHGTRLRVTSGCPGIQGPRGLFTLEVLPIRVMSTGTVN